MILKQITLENFRNIKSGQYTFSPSLTVIQGNNSKGKTNLLESIYFLITGTGFREEKEAELINFDKNYLTVGGFFDDGQENNTYLIRIEKKDAKTVKSFYLNKTLKRHLFYQKELPGAVLFTPEQITIINGPPSERRKYFNILISSYDNEYKKRLNNYEVAIRKRNRILEKHGEVQTLIDELKFWNEYIEKQADYITFSRQQYIDFLNNNKKLDSKEFSIKYLKNEFNQINLKKVFEKEKLIRKTLIGPQKDDFRIIINNDKDIHHYGSRSEERLAVFWLKINELRYFEKLNKKPLLLLDDIFSELDKNNQKVIFPLIRNYQTVATTTEKKIFESIRILKNVINL